MTTRAGELELTPEPARAEPPAEVDAARPLSPRVLRPSVMDEPAAAEPPLTFARWAAATLARWRIVRRGTLLGLGVAILALLVVDPVYRSEATFATQGASGLKLGAGGASVGALAAIASQFGMSAPGAEPSDSPEFYGSLIRGRELLTRLAASRVPDPRTSTPSDSATVLDLLVDSVSLSERLGVREHDPHRRVEKGVRILGNDVVDVTWEARTGIVLVEVETKWPEVSSAIANRIVALVGAYNIEQRQTRAKARRQFTESRLSDAQAELGRAEARLRGFYESNRQWRTAPLLMFEESRLRRQVEVATEMYLTLRREYETARIAEVNDAPVISVLDTAVAPRRRTRPQPVAMLVATTLVGSLVGLLIAAIAAAAADWRKRDPESAGALRTAWRQLVAESLPSMRRRRRVLG